MNRGSRVPVDTPVFSRYFEELVVGDSFAAGPRVIGDEEVLGFAALSGDWHPQHTDAEWAERSRFGKRIAHGMLILSCGLGMIPVDPEKALALRRVREAVFKRPLYIGEAIRVRGRVQALLSVDEQTGIVICGCRVVNEGGRCVVAVRIEVLWRRSGSEALKIAQGDGAVVVAG
jgi:3-hydroxybutyryl-CoA dehydratase